MLAVLNLIAAFNGALVGLVLLAQERFGPVRTRTTLGLFLLTISGLLALFVLLDQGRVAYSAPLGLAMDVAALASAALLYDYIQSSVSRRSPGPWPYAPVGLYLAAAAIHGGRLGAPTDLRLIIAVQMLYSAAALLVFLRARWRLPPGWSRRPEHLHLPVLLGGMGLLHIAQLLRLAMPGDSLVFDLAPLIGALGLIAFALYAVIGSQTLRSLAGPRLPDVGDDAFGRRLDAVVAGGRAFLDPDLSLPRVAALMQTRPQVLSAYLNGVRGLSFPAYVNGLRVAEAMRLLRAPEEARTSVEAIAGLCGFRSRSSFYVAFQGAAGMNPQDYRAGPKTPS